MRESKRDEIAGGYGSPVCHWHHAQIMDTAITRASVMVKSNPLRHKAYSFRLWVISSFLSHNFDDDSRSVAVYEW